MKVTREQLVSEIFELYEKAEKLRWEFIDTLEDDCPICAKENPIDWQIKPIIGYRLDREFRQSVYNNKPKRLERLTIENLTKLKNAIEIVIANYK